MEISPIEGQIDEYLCKEAGYVFGQPQNLGQVATQTALYMAPITGTAMTLKDAYNDFRGGHFWSGLWNTGVGVASGIADVFTLGAGGTAMRAALKSGKLANMANKARQMYRVGSMMRARQLGRVGNGAVKFMNAGKALNPAMNYGGGKLGNYVEDRMATKALGQNPQQQQQQNWQAMANPQQQQGFQFGAQQQNVPPAKPRYGYNPNTYRYERMY